MHLKFLPLAAKDLENIADYIAQENPHRAITFVRELRAQCRKIAQSPLAYRSRPELGEGIRSCAHGRYMIFFSVNDGVLQIIRVLHGAMDIDSRFGNANV